jgi:hypothetical protein
MEIIIKGPGEVAICFIDRKGKTLIQEEILSSGSETVEIRRNVSLVVETNTGHGLVAPVIVRQSEQQQVTFDGNKPSSFTKKRCQEIGCTDSVAEAAERGCAQSLQVDEIRLTAIEPIVT